MHRSKQKWQFSEINGVRHINREIIVHQCEMTGAFAGHLGVDSNARVLVFSQWMTSDAGVWVYDHAVDKPRIVHCTDIARAVEQYAIYARLIESDITFFELKFK